MLSATPRATLTHLSCFPNFPRASYLDERTLTNEPIVKYRLNKQGGVKVVDHLSYKLIRSGFESFDIFNAGATNKKKKFLNFSVDLFETIVVLSTNVSSIFRLRYIDHFDKWLYHSPEDFRHGAVSRLRQEAGFMFVDVALKLVD